MESLTVGIPSTFKEWLQYIREYSDSGFPERKSAYETAIHALPMCYKIWRLYIDDYLREIRPLNPTGESYLKMNQVFENCLIYLHKMPSIWVLYLNHLMKQGDITLTRRTFDRSLQSLPVTQHDKIWPLFLQFVDQAGVSVLYSKVIKRYLMFAPFDREFYIQKLLDNELWDEAIYQLSILLDPTKTKITNQYSIFMKLCDVITLHPGDIKSVDVDNILRAGISRFSEEVGHLWCSLADYYSRLGMLDKCREVYEEAILSVSSVRDFAIVFDAYVRSEEAIFTSKLTSEGDSSVGLSPSPEPSQLLPLRELTMNSDDINLRLARLELLIERRPLLLSAVVLRQNPHNVSEWLNRAKLFIDARAISNAEATFAEATRTVIPSRAIGQPSLLWIEWAKHLESCGKVDEARSVLQRATVLNCNFTNPDDLVSAICEWAELEIRSNNAVAALKIVSDLTSTIGENSDVSSQSLRKRAARSTRLWGLRLDLGEALESVEEVKLAYEKCISARVATPQMVLNFASYLETRDFFEDSFRAFERGVAAFPWPHVRVIWVTYLEKFVHRYGASKIERCRDLFERAVTSAPVGDAMLVYSLYADFEEKCGSPRHALAIYDRAVAAVDRENLFELFIKYIAHAEKYYGAARTRELYERSLEVLPDSHVKDMCLRFANMETKLGEIERARAIFVHASSFCDPSLHVEFWQLWQDWEVQHGNEDTFRELLRVKKSVAARYTGKMKELDDLLASVAQEDSRKRTREIVGDIMDSSVSKSARI